MRRSTAEQNSEGYISSKPTVLLFNAPNQASEQLRCLTDEYRSNQVTDIRFDTKHDSSALQWHSQHLGAPSLLTCQKTQTAYCMESLARKDSKERLKGEEEGVYMH